MNCSEKQKALANSIITEMNDIIQTRKDKDLARIEKMIAKGKCPNSFITRNAPYAHYNNLIVSIVSGCNDSTKIIDARDEILRAVKKGSTQSAWAGIAFLVGGMSREEINSGKHLYSQGEN